ncbi:hypothetical protein CHS0354_011001 [Potamilus streckersoni]|uniref:Uncharacterized protein n=1 Tax=Potamilus streckersoni TaxID=2493646 RepID=A0AAE0TL21_9BIVA|nr:hypothetical protein CHS0354_011001 [Potamilus streckersoni]
MAERLVQNISADYLTCIICCSQYEDPRKFPCEHSYCLKCIKNYIEKNLLRSGQSKLRCPICREITIDLPEDDSLDSWIYEQLPRDSLIVSLTETLNLHLRRLSDSSDDDFSIKEAKVSNAICEKHPGKERDVFCSKHEITICSECAWRHHHGKECICSPLEEVVSKRTVALSSLLKKQCAEAKKHLEETSLKIKQDTIRSIDEINESFKQFCIAFNDRVETTQNLALEALNSEAAKALQVDLQWGTEMLERLQEDNSGSRFSLDRITSMWGKAADFEENIKIFRDELEEKAATGIDRGTRRLDNLVREFYKTLSDHGDDQSSGEWTLVENREEIPKDEVTDYRRFAMSETQTNTQTIKYRESMFSARRDGEKVNMLSSVSVIETTGILVVDQVNRKVKKFKLPEGLFLDDLVLSEELEPNQVCTLLDSSDAAVTVWEDRRVFILGTDPKLSIKSVISLDFEAFGVCSPNQNCLALSSVRSQMVALVSIDDYEVSPKFKPKKRQRLQKGPFPYRMTANKGRVIVADKRKKEVSCINVNRSLVWTKSLTVPCKDVCVMGDNIFVSLAEGKGMGYIRDDGFGQFTPFETETPIHRPWALSGIKDCLVVTEEFPSAIVHVFVK